jgi:hypothetical protein
VQQCAAAVRQSAAVRVAVCGSAAWGAAVQAAECSSVSDSVRQCDTVGQCVPMRAAVCGSASQ